MSKPIFTRGFKQPEFITERQYETIENLEALTGFIFSGTTRQEASDFIQVCLDDLEEDRKDDLD